MLQMAQRTRVRNERQAMPALVADFGLEEEASPFGLQGLKRETMQLLKPECINRLAVTLALRGTPQQIRDPQFVQTILDRNPEWVDEYRVVHLIEKSLWINGRSDLVMTLLKNPSQIPDNPPREIHEALSRANTLHPQATVWYGVPLFGEEVNEEGLPIPLTAAQVREEAARRITAAQKHALRWGWLYRAAMGMVSLSSRIGHAFYSLCKRVYSAGQRMSEFYRQARRDAKRRAIAAMNAEMERQRYGCSFTRIPDLRQTTMIGRWALFGIEIGYFFEQAFNYAAPISETSTDSLPQSIATILPLLMFPMTVVACDPFLFVELPEEPGKLRHLGHWYWQVGADGKKKLHLHA